MYVLLRMATEAHRFLRMHLLTFEGVREQVRCTALHRTLSIADVNWYISEELVY